MDLKVGDSVSYVYPNPLNSIQKEFGGIIEIISESHIIIKNEKNVRLKVSFKNFDQIFLNGIGDRFKEFKPENYYG